MKRFLFLGLALGAACNHPSPTCTADETDCATTSGGTTSSGTNGGSSSSGAAACSHPDLYAACFQGGGLVGICSESGLQSPPAIVAAPAPGGGNSAVIGNLGSLIFTSPTMLWALDEENNQIDVLDTSSWPPTNVMSIAAGTGSDFDAVTMIECGNQVLVVEDTPPLVAAYNASSGAFVAEVKLALDGGAPDPGSIACDAANAYVTDFADNVLFVIDLASFTVSGVLSPPAQELIAPVTADGGTFDPGLAVVTVVSPTGAGPEIFAGLQNYALFGQQEEPVADSLLLEVNSAGTALGSPIDLGACYDVSSLITSPDQSTIYASCAGTYHINGIPNASGQLGSMTVTGTVPHAPVTLPLSDPSSMAFLANGWLAIGDTGSAGVAFYNPADGGVTSLTASCPLLSDGGVNPLQFVGALVAAP
jgi:hypothetical protein